MRYYYNKQSPALAHEPQRVPLLEVLLRAPEHPNRERELEVRVRDRARLIEHALDGFLRP